MDETKKVTSDEAESEEFEEIIPVYANTRGLN